MAVVGAVTLAVGGSAGAEDTHRRAEADAAHDARPATGWSASPGLRLQVRTGSAASWSGPCGAATPFTAAGTSLVTTGAATRLQADCHDCCAEVRIFLDGFESGGTEQWTHVVPTP